MWSRIFDLYANGQFSSLLYDLIVHICYTALFKKILLVCRFAKQRFQRCTNIDLNGKKRFIRWGKNAQKCLLKRARLLSVLEDLFLHLWKASSTDTVNGFAVYFELRVFLNHFEWTMYLYVSLLCSHSRAFVLSTNWQSSFSYAILLRCHPPSCLPRRTRDRGSHFLFYQSVLHF